MGSPPLTQHPRFLSIQPHVDHHQQFVAYRVELLDPPCADCCDGAAGRPSVVKYVGYRECLAPDNGECSFPEPCGCHSDLSCYQDGGCTSYLAELRDDPEYRVWNADVIHVRGCEIYPGRQYAITATRDATDPTALSPPLLLTTSSGSAEGLIPPECCPTESEAEIVALQSLPPLPKVHYASPWGYSLLDDARCGSTTTSPGSRNRLKEYIRIAGSASVFWESVSVENFKFLLGVIAEVNAENPGRSAQMVVHGKPWAATDRSHFPVHAATEPRSWPTNGPAAPQAACQVDVSGTHPGDGHALWGHASEVQYYRDRLSLIIEWLDEYNDARAACCTDPANCVHCFPPADLSHACQGEAQFCLPVTCDDPSLNGPAVELGAMLLEMERFFADADGIPEANGWKKTLTPPCTGVCSHDPTQLCTANPDCGGANQCISKNCSRKSADSAPACTNTNQCQPGNLCLDGTCTTTGAACSTQDDCCNPTKDEWNAAVANKHADIQQVIHDLLGEIRVEHYGRCVRDLYAPTELDAGLLSEAIYNTPIPDRMESGMCCCQQIAGTRPITPWIALGGSGSVESCPGSTFDFRFDYPPRFSRQLGAWLNCANDASRPGIACTAANRPAAFSTVGDRVVFWPRAFDAQLLGRWGRHFIAYVEGAYGVGPSPDCNDNGALDLADVMQGSSLDCDVNGTPDECEPDCDGNGVPDACETVVYVDGAGPGANNGSGWADAYHDLQDALELAACSAYPVQIRVAQGTYRPDRGTLGRNAHFALLDGATVLGGYAGYGAPNPDDRNPTAYVTVLSGDLLGDDGPDFANRGDNSYSVVSKTATTSAAVLDGFTIRGGNGETSGGGGLSGDGSSLVRDCTFTDNFAVAGGAVHNATAASSPTLEDCRFTANRAWAGGAIYNIGSASPTITGCEFTDNTAVAFGAWGGAVYNAVGASPTVDSCSFSGNSAEGEGGAVFNVAGSFPEFSSCTFSDNLADAGGAVYSDDGSSPLWTGCTFTGNSATHGGALYNSGNAAQITNCTFTGNSATRGAGVYYTGGAAGALNDGIFSGNVAADLGGAVYLDACSPAIGGTVFDGNAAGPDGGAIYNAGGSPVLTLCWFESNVASGRGGAVYNVGAANPAFAGCVFLANNATRGGAMGSENSTPTVAGCTFDSNAANEGGALYLYKWPSTTGNPRFTDCTFVRNNAVQSGGAVFNDDNVRGEFTDCLFDQNVASLRGGAMWTQLAGAPAIRGCRFAGNHSDADGGALYYSGGTLDVVDSTFYLNYAFTPDGSGSRGGAIYNAGGSGCVANCKLIHNLALGLASHGGGIYCGASAGGSAIDLTNCLFDGNATYGGISSGGGVYNAGSTVRVRNCTLGSNWAMRDGGAIHTRGADGALVVTNSVLWSNVHNGGVMDAAAQIYVGAGTATVDESDVQGCWNGAGSNDICQDPLYRDLYGPDGAYGTEDDDLRVVCASSPVVNNGSNALVPPDTCDVDDDGNTTETTPLDLDGVQRIRNTTGDMGAYECPPPASGGGIKPKPGGGSAPQ
ncbi:MAG: right-handed parallel beta-helix repeat-containing protein [Planctomycetes bacterium]|nr:right-handed parallel beta-helix repeat-containing protein [Planctomycetota bacterium]